MSRKQTNSGLGSAKPSRSRVAGWLMPLEPRIMFDGAAAHAALSASSKALIPVVPPPVAVHAAAPAQNNGKTEVAFVDTSVPDWQALVAGVEKTSPGVEVELIDGGQRGLAQIATWAETHAGYDAIHILSQGSDASFTVGTDTINNTALGNPVVQAELGEIGTALKAGGELALYGSGIAAGSDGQHLLAALSADTGAVVAASDHAVGAASQGGDWTLDTATGVTTVSPLAISGYLGTLGIGAQVTDTAPAPVEVQAANPSLDGGLREVAFIDTSVAGWETLVTGIQSSRPGMAIELIDGTQSGLAQMADWAATHSGYDAIHVLSHAAEAELYLGTDLLTDASLSAAATRTELAGIGAALKPNGDLLLYGCDTGENSDGDRFLTDLAVDTGANVAGATHLIGAVALGGDWMLDRQTGPIDVASLAITSYDNVLGVFGSPTSTFTIQNATSAYYFEQAVGTPNNGVAVLLQAAAGPQYIKSYTATGTVNYAVEINTLSGVSLPSSNQVNILAASNGDLVVAYNNNDSGDGGSFNAYFVVLNSAGSEITSPTRINTATGSSQTRNVELAQLTNGNIAFAYQESDDQTIGVRIFQLNGTAVTNETAITGGQQDGFPDSVTASASGGFMVAYKGYVYSNSQYTSWVGYSVFDNTGALQENQRTYTDTTDNNFPQNYAIALSNGDYLYETETGSYGNYNVSAVIYSPSASVVVASANVGGAFGAGYITPVDTASDPGYATWAYDSTYAADVSSSANYTDVPAKMMMTRYSNLGVISGAATSVDSVQASLNFTNSSNFTSDTPGYYIYSGYTQGVIEIREVTDSVSTGNGESSNETSTWAIGAQLFEMASGPSISSVAYDAATGNLTLTGSSFTTSTGDYTVADLTLTGASGGTYTLGSSDTVTSASATSVVIHIGTSDQATLDGLLNAAGTHAASNGTTYNLAVASGWDTSATAAATNAVTVTDSGTPSLTHANTTAPDATIAGGTAVTIDDGTITATDSPDLSGAGVWSGGNLQVQIGATNHDSSHDELSIATTGGITTSGSGAAETVSYNGHQIGAIQTGDTGTPGQTLQIALSGSYASDAAVQALVSAIRFNDSAATTAGDRTVSFVLTDAYGKSTSALSDTVHVIAGPSVSSINRTVVASTPTNATTESFTVTFSETVTGVVAADFSAVPTGSVADTGLSVSGSGASYTVTINGVSGDGTLGLNLTSVGSIQDGSNVALTATHNSDQTYTIDNTAPVIGSLNGDTALYVVGGAAVLLDSTGAATVTEANIASGGVLTVSISNDQAAEDVIGLHTAAGHITTVGSGTVTLSDNGTVIGTYSSAGNGSSGNNLVVTLGTGDSTTQVADLIHALTYTDTSATPATTPRTVDVTLTDAAGNVSATSAVTVSLDHRPVVAAGDTVSVVRTQTGSVLDGAIVVSDADGNWSGGTLAVQITGNADSTHDSLALPTTSNAGIWLNGTNLMDGAATQIGSASAASVTGGTAWTFTFNANATNTAITALADAVQLAVSGGGSLATRTVSFTATDGDGIAGTTATDTVSVLAQPSISGGTSHSSNDATTTTPLSGITIADGSTEGVTVSVSFSDTLGDFTGLSGWSSNTVSTTRTYTRDFASAALANAALSAMVFTPTAHEGNVGTQQTATFTVSATGDTTSLSTGADTAASAVITYANTTPTITAGGGTVPTYAVGANPVAIDSAITVADPDNGGSGNWSGGTLLVHIQTGADSSHDELSIASTGSNSGISVSSNVVDDNGVQIGTIHTGKTGTPGTDLQIDLGAAATDASVQALAQAIQFGDSGQSSSAADRTVKFTVTDGAAASDFATDTVHVLLGPTVSTIDTHLGARTLTNATSVSFDVTFSESVTGVGVNDFTLATTGTVTGTIASVSGSGANWTVTVTGVSGNGTITLDQTAAGSVVDGNSVALIGTHNGDQLFTIDTIAPAAPSIAATISPDTGVSGTDRITSDAAPTLHGTAEAGSTVTLYDSDGTTVLATVTADGSGDWSIATSTLSDGAHTITATATDGAGNVSVVSAPLSVMIETVAPAAPVIAATISPDTGVSATDRITDDPTPTLHGTAEANSIVTLYDTNGTTVIGTTTADGSGNWSVATSTLPDGTHSITAKATDLAGNVSTVSTALSVTIDTTAPAAPAIAATITPDTGSSATDRITDDATPTLHGTAAAGSTVTLYDTNGTTILATTTADGSGNWSVATTTLQDGTHGITAKATDVAGNVSIASTTLSVTIDTIAPAAPAIAATISPDTGSSATDRITDDPTPTLHGTAEPGSTVTLYDTNGTTVLATTTADGSGNWSVATSTLPDGTHGITAKATDIAGNVSVSSTTLSVTIDTIAPAAPAIAATISPDTGSSTTDRITDDATPTLHGTAEAGSTVTLYDTDGTTVLATTTADGSGNWSVVTNTLADGLHSVTAKATDVAGNVSTASAALSVTIDTTAPAAPVIATTISPDTGSSAVDRITSDATPTLHGTAEAGSTVTLYDTDGTTILATTTADGSGNWSVVTNTLADGLHSVTARATDVAGNLSVASGPLLFIIDTVAPAAPVIGATISPDTGSSTTDRITDVNTPTLNGTAEANSTVTLYDTDGTTVLATTRAAVSGNWSVATSSLPDGIHSITAKATDIAGNVSVASTALSLTIDTVAPAAPVIAATITPDTGSSATDRITDDATPTLHGTAEAGSTVTLYDTDGTTVLATATADGSGNWSVATSTLADGTHSITAKATDVAGNVSTVSAARSVTIDTVAPAAPVIAVTISPDTGSSATDRITDDAAPTLHGTAEAGSTVTLYDTDGTTILATTTADGSGNWSVATSTLPDGTHNITAKATDVAGNVSAASSVLSVTIDTTAPAAPVIAATISPDTGRSPTDRITDDATPTLHGTAEAGSTVTLYDTDGITVLATTTADGSGNWSVATTTLADGTHSISAKATDIAGNVSTASSILAVTIDTLAPAAPGIAATISPDTGSSATDRITDDATPTLHGTAEAGSTVTLYDTDGTTVLATTTADGNGNWSVATSTLADGPHSVTAKATDVAGNVSAVSNALSITIDTTAPAAPIIAATITPDTGSSATDRITTATTPTLSGTAEAGSTITLYDSDGTTILASTIADGSGNWSVATSTLANGTHSITATATDVAGNVSIASTALPVTIDTHTPAAPSISGLTPATDTGLPGVTSDTTPTVTGTGEPGSTVTLYDGPTVIGTATVSPGGTWSVATPPLADGVHALTSTVTDTAGTTGAASAPFALTIDTHIPAPPAITGLTAATDTGGPGLTSNRLPVLVGTAEPGSTVTLYDGTTVLGTTTASSAGQWTFAVAAPLADGSHALTATATDAAATVGAHSQPLDLSIAPTAAQIIPAQTWNGSSQNALTVPPGTFDLPAGDHPVYQAELVNADGSVAGPLPPWLSVDPASGALTGAVPLAATGTLHLQLTVIDDNGDTASTVFDLHYQGPPAPQVAPPAPPPPPAAPPPTTTAAPVQIVTIVRDNPTPSPNALPGFQPALTNTDVLSAPTEPPVQPAAQTPTLAVSAIPDPALSVNGAVSYAIGVETLHAGSSGPETIHLSASLADGAPLPSWLRLDPATRTISGLPPPGSGPVVIVITATDGQGHSARTVVHIGSHRGSGTAPNPRGAHNTLLPDSHGRLPLDPRAPVDLRMMRSDRAAMTARPGLTAQIRSAHRAGQLAHQAALLRAAEQMLRRS